MNINNVCNFEMLKFEKGSEVLVSNYTMVATANIVEMAGLIKAC